MAVKKGRASRVSKVKGQPKKAKGGSASSGDELLEAGLSLADQSRLNGKYERFEAIEERVKEVERVKRFIFANLMRTAVGMAKNAQKGTNSAGAKLLWDFAEIDKLPRPGTQAPSAAAGAEVGDVCGEEKAEDDDPTKAVLSFYKKLGMTPPRLKPPKAAEAAEEEQEAALL